MEIPQVLWLHGMTNDGSHISWVILFQISMLVRCRQPAKSLCFCMCSRRTVDLGAEPLSLHYLNSSSAWMEETIIIDLTCIILFHKPKSLSNITRGLIENSHADKGVCQSRIGEAVQWHGKGDTQASTGTMAVASHEMAVPGYEGK